VFWTPASPHQEVVFHDASECVRVAIPEKAPGILALRFFPELVLGFFAISLFFPEIKSFREKMEWV
jgi:hypothetical protein